MFFVNEFLTIDKKIDRSGEGSEEYISTSTICFNLYNKSVI